MMMMILSLVVVMLMLWIVTMMNMMINWSPGDDFYILMEKMVNIG